MLSHVVVNINQFVEMITILTKMSVNVINLEFKLLMLVDANFKNYSNIGIKIQMIMEIGIIIDGTTGVHLLINPIIMVSETGVTKEVVQIKDKVKDIGIGFLKVLLF